MKKYLVLLFLALISLDIYSLSGDGKGISLGVGGGYDGYKTFRGEIYMKQNAGNILGRRGEVRLGLNNRSYDFDFCGVNDQKAQSINLFGDLVLYPFHRGLFAGLRWEVVSLNWMGDNTKNRIERGSGYKVTPWYIGANYFFQVGYDFKLSDKYTLKVISNVGLHRYTISDGVYSYWGYAVGGDKSETKNKLSYNITLCFEIRL